MLFRFFLAGLCLYGALPVLAETPLPTVNPAFEVAVSEGIIYGQGEVEAPTAGHKNLLLDLYEPVAAGLDGELLPAVVIIHGGGFFGGSRRQEELVRIANEMASRGYVAISIDYRLIPDEPVPSARVEPLLQAIFDDQGELPTANAKGITAAIDDGLTAIDWLHASADNLGVDTDRIGLVGASAGAITSVHLAYVLDNHGLPPQALRFVVDFWGGSVIPPNDRAAAAAHLDAVEPPLIAIHGTHDQSVSVEYSDLLVARALDQGLAHEYYRIEGAGHGFVSVDIFTLEASPGVTLFERVLSWTREALLGPTIFSDGFESGDTSAWP